MRINWSVKAAICIGALGAVHCGDDGDSKGSPDGSGVSGSKALIDLTDADAQKLCEFERDSYLASLTSEEAYCFRTGSVFSASSCEQDIAECVASSDYEDELDDAWDCERSTVEDYVEGDDCEATVAEFEACIKSDDSQSKAFYDKASCDSDPEDRPDDTSACEKLLDKCFDPS